MKSFYANWILVKNIPGGNNPKGGKRDYIFRISKATILSCVITESF